LVKLINWLKMSVNTGAHRAVFTNVSMWPLLYKWFGFLIPFLSAVQLPLLVIGWDHPVPTDLSLTTTLKIWQCEPVIGNINVYLTKNLNICECIAKLVKQT
jgi:hypothetical protein